MTEIAKTYSPNLIEKKWYQNWLDNKYFHSEPDDTKEPYSIVIPPPNVTGVLHMGHILNNAIQDVLIRKARMEGKNACWVPGTDHASIATEAKVVNKLKQQGISKFDIGRKEFLKHAWEWTNEHGGIILKQLRTLGASCDWDRTKFTLDDDLYASVIKVFVDLYNKGLIYRGIRMINWDPEAKTAVSDEEVEYKETPGHLYHVRYKLTDSEDYVIIATTRPETILADTAICVNPNDEKFKHLHGKKVIVPIINREIPIITDEYVDMEFGTGCLKITPAHDPNDYEIGLKHNLEVIDIFNDNGTLNEKAKFYIGKTREEARKLIMNDIKAAELHEKTENYMHKVGYSQRTHVAIEPKISTQWFLKMADLAKPALENVMNDTIRFYPEMYKNTYKHWMENVRDWNISRQLWWGHRIPAYYIKDTNEYVVAETIQKALEIAKQKTNNNTLTENDLKQDEDVLDTWFSSWLWPISVFNGITEPNNKDINYYYPTNILATGHDIIFFWVARMVISGYEYRNQYPFKDVYFTGMVRDEQRRKMSKQLGNSPDPLDLIEKYGADAVRMGMLFCSPAGNDLLYKESLIEQGSAFCNKIWNSFRLINSWQIDENIDQPQTNKIAIKWLKNNVQHYANQINDQFEKYRLSDALHLSYKLYWEEFCAWYLEIIKPEYQKPIDAITYKETIGILNKLLQLLHPFMPFITEEVWHLANNKTETETIMFEPWIKESTQLDNVLLNDFDMIKNIVNSVRNIRKEKNIANKNTIEIFVSEKNPFDIIKYKTIPQKLCNINEIKLTNSTPEQAISFVIESNEYFVPLADNIDIDAEIEKLNAEKKYAEGFIKAIEKKLQNENFVKNAPEQVVEKERKKYNDALNKIQAINQQINKLQK